MGDNQIVVTLNYNNGAVTVTYEGKFDAYVNGTTTP